MCIEKKVKLWWEEKLKEVFSSPFGVDSLDRSRGVQWGLAQQLLLSVTETHPGPDWAAQQPRQV